MSWRALIAAIPHSIKRQITNNLNIQEGNFILNVGLFKPISKTRSRDFYQILTTTIFF